jgi:hypothetical protein
MEISAQPRLRWIALPIGLCRNEPSKTLRSKRMECYRSAAIPRWINIFAPANGHPLQIDTYLC